MQIAEELEEKNSWVVYQIIRGENVYQQVAAGKICKTIFQWVLHTQGIWRR